MNTSTLSSNGSLQASSSHIETISLIPDTLPGSDNNQNLPLSLTRSNGAVLVDLENIRLAWELHYRTLFDYRDLCRIISELQLRFLFNCVFIGVYATETNDVVGQINRERNKRKSGMSHQDRRNPVIVQSHQRHDFHLQLRAKNYDKLINTAKSDMKMTQCYDMESFKSKKFDLKELSASKYDRLGGVGQDSRHCQVKIETFRLKGHQGRQVQRGCDASIVHDIMILNYSESIDSVWVLTGDSDFYEILQKVAERKSERICSLLSFNSAISSQMKSILRSHSYPPTGDLSRYLKMGQCNFFEIETTLPAVNPVPLMLRGRRIPCPLEDSLSHQSSVLPKNYKFHADYKANCEAAENRWVQLELKTKNSMKTLEQITKEADDFNQSPKSSPKNKLPLNMPFTHSKRDREEVHSHGLTDRDHKRLKVQNLKYDEIGGINGWFDKKGISGLYTDKEYHRLPDTPNARAEGELIIAITDDTSNESSDFEMIEEVIIESSDQGSDVAIVDVDELVGLPDPDIRLGGGRSTPTNIEDLYPSGTYICPYTKVLQVPSEFSMKDKTKEHQKPVITVNSLSVEEHNSARDAIAISDSDDTIEPLSTETTEERDTAVPVVTSGHDITTNDTLIIADVPMVKSNLSGNKTVVIPGPDVTVIDLSSDEP